MALSQTTLRSLRCSLLLLGAFISGCSATSIRPNATLKDGDGLVLFNTTANVPREVDMTSFSDGKVTSLAVEEVPSYWLLSMPAGGYTLAPPTNTNLLNLKVTWWEKTQFEVRPGVINYIGDLRFGEESFRHRCDVRAAEAYLQMRYPEKSKTMPLVNKCQR
jgi:hypothetical protein